MTGHDLDVDALDLDAVAELLELLPERRRELMAEAIEAGATVTAVARRARVSRQHAYRLLDA